MYEYKSLHNLDDAIRVLVVQPSEDEKAPLRIKLEPANLNAGPSYDAISYVWGPKNNDAWVLYDSANGTRYIQIPANLYVALLHLRHEKIPCRIWADAICIDQTNEIERGQQVALMRRIFQQATSVVVWLGIDNSEEAKNAFPFFEDLTQNLKTSVRMEMIAHGDGIHHIASLFKQVWFRRLWCLQEVVLARSEIILTWGAYTISWNCVGKLASWLALILPSGFSMDEDTKVGIRNATIMHALRSDIWESPSRRCSFLELLTIARPFLATDARDRVFALLGIPSTDAEPEVTGQLFLQPNYEKTLDEIYLACAQKIIQVSGNLNILSYVQHGDATHIKAKHSWVPYWNRNFTRTIALIDRKSNAFAAAGQHSLRYTPSGPRNDGNLSVSGIRLTSVREISIIIQRDMADELPGLMSGIWENFFIPLRSHTVNTEILREICLTVTAGKDWQGRLVENDVGHICDFVACMYEPRNLQASSRERPNSMDWSENGLEQLQMELFDPRSDREVLGGEQPGNAENFKEAFVTACTQRRIFSTEKCHIGLGPRAMQPGDHVCLLEGATVPIILRPSKEGFKVVGEAYVSGVMQGEAWEIGLGGTESTQNDVMLERFILT